MTVSNDESLILPSDIYHYTSAAGLLGILDTTSMWATHAGFLNDSEELIYGYRDIQRVVANLKLESDVPPELEDESLWPSVPEGTPRWALGRALLNALFDSDLSVTYLLERPRATHLACFSARRDELSQWRGYANNGGYAICFDSQLLRDSAQSIAAAIDDSGEISTVTGSPVLMPVRYSTDDSWIRSKSLELLRHTLIFLRDHARADPISPHIEQIGVKALDPHVAWVTALMAQTKNPSFIDEQEYRIFAFGRSTRFTASDKIGLIPRLDIKFDARCIKEIIIGPGVNQHLRCSSIEYFCKVRPHYAHVVITPSSTPYRGV